MVFEFEKFGMLVQADGWIVDKISLLANPNQNRPARFWGVYTKLKIFNMTSYKKGNCGYYAFFCFRDCWSNNVNL